MVRLVRLYYLGGCARSCPTRPSPRWRSWRARWPSRTTWWCPDAPAQLRPGSWFFLRKVGTWKDLKDRIASKKNRCPTSAWKRHLANLGIVRPTRRVPLFHFKDNIFIQLCGAPYWIANDQWGELVDSQNKSDPGGMVEKWTDLPAVLEAEGISGWSYDCWLKNVENMRISHSTNDVWGFSQRTRLEHQQTFGHFTKNCEQDCRNLNLPEIIGISQTIRRRYDCLVTGCFLSPRGRYARIYNVVGWVAHPPEGWRETTWGVFMNGGSPKSSICYWIPLINHPFGGVPPFMETPTWDYWTNGCSSPNLSFHNELSQLRTVSQPRAGQQEWSVRKLQSKLKMVEKQWEVWAVPDLTFVGIWGFP